MEVSHPVPRHHPTSATHPPFSETKGINNGSFTSVLLHASSSSVLSDSGEFPTHCSHGPGALGTQRASFEQSLRQGTSEFSRSRPAHSRGSCRKCVECTRLTEHRIVDQAKTLWPGQLVRSRTRVRPDWRVLVPFAYMYCPLHLFGISVFSLPTY